MPTKKPAETALEIQEMRRGGGQFWIVGTQPLIYNAVSAKAKRELMQPPQTKSRAQRGTSAKKMPVLEYRDSVYRRRDHEPGDTTLVFPAVSFKKAMRTAALEMDGIKGTMVDRLIWVQDLVVSVWGTPELLCSVVRNSDPKRTPDIRTRAILPQWCCRLTLRWVEPKLTAVKAARLLSAAGIVSGVGDFRQEKGAGAFGQYRLADPDDEEVTALLEHGGRAAQDAALRTPVSHDAETDDLLAFWHQEVRARDFALPDDALIEDYVS